MLSYGSYVGFFRVIFVLLSIILMATGQHDGAMVLYLVSSMLDAFDGMAARHFNQCSQFGAALDMVTDRSATMMLLCALCRLYPAIMMPLFQILLALDLSSHYIHMLR